MKSRKLFSVQTVKRDYSDRFKFHIASFINFTINILLIGILGCVIAETM